MQVMDSGSERGCEANWFSRFVMKFGGMVVDTFIKISLTVKG